ncbi:MAG TPA: alginate export family protein [Candidatus Acidoferrales bacterium]|nr:alginate export family protein [Candidatus Acidoferrales bacterium]
MKLLSILALVLLAGALAAQAQSDQPGGPPVPDRSYKLLREDEDWSFLQNSTLRQDFWDPIKYIPLRSGADDWFLTIGGEAREVWEQIGNDNWGQQPYMNGFFNERYMLYFHARYGKHIRSFVEFKSGLNSFRIGGPRPIDEKKLDFQAAFLEAATSGDRNWIKFRVGRQELEYGSGRLIDVREGPNVRLSFDGFVVKTKLSEWHIDGFAVRPDLDKPGFFDNAPNHAVGFWGVYATRPLTNKVSLDVYYLGLDRKQAAFERGTAQEVRHSVGARISRPIAAERPGWDFDYEGLWQFGTFGSNEIRAWTIASETGYRFPTVRLKPRFSAKADISSGDNPTSKSLGTFNPLFPKGNYFGVLATTGPGPINFIDVHPRAETEFPHGVAVSLDWIVQWRESLLDGVYAVPGFLIRAADGSRARFVGHRPGTEVRWQANRHLWFQADYGVFYAGNFLKQTQPGRNLNYWALWAGYKY